MEIFSLQRWLKDFVQSLQKMGSGVPWPQHILPRNDGWPQIVGAVFFFPRPGRPFQQADALRYGHGRVGLGDKTTRSSREHQIDMLGSVSASAIWFAGMFLPIQLLSKPRCCESEHQIVKWVVFLQCSYRIRSMKNATERSRFLQKQSRKRDWPSHPKPNRTAGSSTRTSDSSAPI